MLATAWTHRKGYQIAVIEVFSGSSFIWAFCIFRLVRLLKKRTVLVLHGGRLPDFARSHPLLIRSLLSSADRVFAPSEYLRAKMLEYRKEIGILPNGIELPNYSMRLRSQLKPDLVWLRAFDAIYNPSLAIEAVALLRNEFPGIRLTMVGPDKDGSLRDVMMLVARHGLSDQVSFTGCVPKSKVPQMLNAGDIFLSTTTVDNSPISLTEAMACGLPVVSTNVGGVPYLVEDEVDALLVPSGDAVAMAAAIRRLLTDPLTAGRLSKNGREKAERFDWSVIMPQWESMLVGLTS